MRINMAKCENKNSRRECSAMANGDTRSNRNTRKLAGFLMCSTALSHFPSQNYLITEKIYKQKNSYFITNGRSILAEKRRIQEQASWRVSSEVISIRLPSVTFHLEIVLRCKKFLQAENLAVFYYQRQSHDCGDHVVWLISICYWRYNVIFDTPRSPPAEKSFSLLLEIFNFAMLFFFLPNFD